MIIARKARRASKKEREGGFTLIELVVSIAILGLIVGPLTGAVVLFFSQSQQTASAFTGNTSVRTIVSAFTTDAASAETVTAPDTAPCGTTDALVTMAWTENGTAYRVSWSAKEEGATTELVRSRCTGTSGISNVAVADITGTPVVTCTPDCANAATIAMTGTTASGDEFAVSAKRRTS
jgi:prepilin-type N-terminal cleavage/methylation domain-containing protein